MKSGMKHGLTTMKEQIFIIKYLASNVGDGKNQRDLMEKICILEQTLNNTIKGRQEISTDIEITCRTIAVEYSCRHYKNAHTILRDYGALKADEMEARYVPILEAVMEQPPEPTIKPKGEGRALTGKYAQYGNKVSRTLSIPVRIYVYMEDHSEGGDVSGYINDLVINEMERAKTRTPEPIK